MDYWAVDFNYESRKEIIKAPRGNGLSGVQGSLPGQEPVQRDLELSTDDFEERWTSAYIFENEWQSFRIRQNRDLELKPPHIRTTNQAATPSQSKSSTFSTTIR